MPLEDRAAHDTSFIVHAHARELWPRRVSAVFREAASIGHRLTRLTEAVRPTGDDPAQRPVAVAHFARFEEPFLRDLLSDGGQLPFELLCTHAMARRLLPGLPRRGLRAVAGYLGHAVPELRRAGPHVIATLLVWRGLVSLLEKEQGVLSLEELRRWLAREPVRAARTYPMDPRTRLELPRTPGVYRFQRTDGSVLYVGKATSLRQRVNTYFQTCRGHMDRTLEMLAQARGVDVTPTGSALEAALLEPDEIKRLRPPYNVALRDKDRRLAFWSWSLRRAAPRPDGRHPVGPFLLQGPGPPLSALLEVLDSGGEIKVADRLSASVLGIPRRYGPNLGGFRAGFLLFVSRHGRCWTAGSPVRAVSSLGARLHRRRDQPDTSEGDGTAPPGARWTPETVADLLEQVVLRGAHALRRARWLMALSECSLAWEPGRGATGRCLVLSGGRVVACHDLARRPSDAPLSPGHATPHFQRQQRVDLAAYDRLSVLSRELKGLVAARRPVALRLGPDTLLDRETLGHALRCL